MSMWQLAVDIGNTTIRMGIFAAAGSCDPLPQPDRVMECCVATVPSREDWSSADWLSADWFAHGPCEWLVASVHRPTQEKLRRWVESFRPSDPYHACSASDLPLRINVDSPERVGMDRLMAAVAAGRIRNPDRAAIVVDAGSAVTVDLVDSEGTFQGGVILPGFRMSAQALAQDTDLLPLAPFSPQDDPPVVVGKSTEAAIRSGLFWGSIGAVRTVIEQMTAELKREPELIVTGGDAQRIAPLLRPSSAPRSPGLPQVRFEANLVLSGIIISRANSR